jgi:hypothetical protein
MYQKREKKRRGIGKEKADLDDVELDDVNELLSFFFKFLGVG